MKEYKWGLLGAGGIIRRWSRGAAQTDGCILAKVASRTKEHAEKTAEELGITAAESYEALVSDPEIDICYVAVPHPFHKELAELAMNHGKHVLVEKPAAVAAADWEEMCRCAEKNGVFLMEAVWTRFFPAFDTIRELFTPEKLGPLKAISATCGGSYPDMMRGHRNLRADMAGGGLLDMGVYCLHLCDILFGGAPEEIRGFASINTDENQFGVDEQAMFSARYPGERLASMGCSVRTSMPTQAFLYGTKGYVELPKIWSPTQLTVHTQAGWESKTETLEIPVPQKEGLPPQEGFAYEIAHVQECVEKGVTQSPVIPWETTARVLRLCDELRAQWGLKFPFEK